MAAQPGVGRCLALPASAGPKCPAGTAGLARPCRPRGHAGQPPDPDLRHFQRRCPPDAGPLELEVEPMLARAARYAIGERLDRPAPVPIDFIFEPYGAGSVVAGS